MSIKAILFDLDDTLLWDDRSVKEAFKATCDYASQQTGVDTEKLEEAVRKEARKLYESYETFSFTKLIGINPFEGLWANFTEGEDENFRKLEQLAPIYRTQSWTNGLLACRMDNPQLGFELGEMFAAERRNRPIVYEETFAVLDKLRGKYKLLLLTNGSPDLQNEKIASVPVLASYFNHIVISGNHGKGKPSASIFQHAMELLDIKAEEGLMVGDKLTTDIMGSNSVGMPSVWMNRHHISRNDDIIPKFEVSNLQELFNIIDQLS
ncbi:MAG: HAD-IA family hydrolase [Paenibacillaceae bacterium]